MSIRPEVRTLPAYHFTAKPHRIKLDQNESPYDLPEPVKRQILTRLEKIDFHRYPELHADTLQRALAQRHAWDTSGVVVSNGSNVLIQALIIACGLGRQVLSVTPTFSVYALQAKVLGAELIEVPLEPDFALPKEALKDTLVQGEGVFFLANPAAPTGNVFSDEDVQDLIEAAQLNWTVVIDEAYQQFSGTDFAPLIKRYDRVVSLRTLSKAFGLAGARLGYALTNSALAENLRKVLLPFSVSALQIATGLSVLEAPDVLDARVEEALFERARVYDALRKLPGLEVFPSQTNFLLFRVADAETFYEALLARGILIRRQDHLLRLKGCLRVSIGTPQENSAFISAAEEICQAQPEREVSRG